jgi:electron transport complex protein RnfD
MASLHFGKLPATSLMDCFLGYVGGSMGEVSAAASAPGRSFIWSYLRYISAHPLKLSAHGSRSHLPVPQGGQGRLVWMAYNLCSGGLMLGAIFMATDYTTSPVTKKGRSSLASAAVC